MSYQPREGGSSLWGSIQVVEDIAPGVWFVHTAGHGGIKISRERMSKLPRDARVTNFSRSGWFEEDCDFAIPALVFEDVRDALGISRERAEGIIKRHCPEKVIKALSLEATA